jgi:hypothetical protein
MVGDRSAGRTVEKYARRFGSVGPCQDMSVTLDAAIPAYVLEFQLGCSRIGVADLADLIAEALAGFRLGGVTMEIGSAELDHLSAFLGRDGATALGSVIGLDFAVMKHDRVSFLLAQALISDRLCAG